MSPRKTAVLLAALATALVVSVAGPALAQATSVTLTAEPRLVLFGREVRLSGEVEPAAPGVLVEIVDANSGAVLATATTDADGTYQLAIEPDRNRVLRADAEAGLVSSDTVNLRVRPVLTARLRNVRLFDGALVTGRLRPAHADRSVLVRLRRGPDVVARRRADLRSDGSFASRFAILRGGAYRADVAFDDGDHARARATTPRVRVSTPPPLGIGSRGRFVRILEARLAALDYHLPGVNRTFDRRTADAVIAFHKVQGMTRRSNVTAATWRRLADPRRPRPVSRRPRHHIEIDQTRQLLFVVDRGDITAILHTSTGKPSTPTYDGVFRVHRKIDGYSPGSLYMPSYFDGNRAVHGWPSVPTYPASHGCARVPMWAARWIYALMPYGTQLRVYHS